LLDIEHPVLGAIISHREIDDGAVILHHQAASSFSGTRCADWSENESLSSTGRTWGFPP
jgi:hypothetical protein